MVGLAFARVAATVIALAALLAGPAADARADDLSYVSDEEIAAEILARSDDLDRTRLRVASIERELARTRAMIDDARFELVETERHVARNAGLLYRLSRHGAALRYLLSSSCATGFLKRVRLLRFLVISGLEARRAAGARLSDWEETNRDLERGLTLANEMVSRLVETKAELVAERDRRVVGMLPAE